MELSFISSLVIDVLRREASLGETSLEDFGGDIKQTYLVPLAQ